MGAIELTSFERWIETDQYQVMVGLKETYNLYIWKNDNLLTDMYVFNRKYTKCKICRLATLWDDINK